MRVVSKRLTSQLLRFADLMASNAFPNPEIGAIVNVTVGSGLPTHHVSALSLAAVVSGFE
jgi:hypothetical protein